MSDVYITVTDDVTTVVEVEEQGPAGPQGSIGETGDAGAAGPTGPQGISGDVTTLGTTISGNFASFTTTSGNEIEDSGYGPDDYYIKSEVDTISGSLNTTKANKGVNADITSMTVLTQITTTSGTFDIAIGGAAGDDFTVDTNKLVVEGDTGKVGIGTTTPSYALDVVGSIRTDSNFYGDYWISSTGDSMNMQPTGDTDDFFSFKTPAHRPTIKREGGKFIYFESSNVYDVGISFRADDIYSGTLNYEKDGHIMTVLGKASPLGFKANSDYDNYIKIQTASNIPEITVVSSSGLKINAGGTNALLLNHDGGNVGIGTTTPGGKLCVNGGVTVGSDTNAGDNNLRVEEDANILGNITISGTVDSVDIATFKSDYDVHTHDDRYYTESEVDTISGSLNTNLATVSGLVDANTALSHTQGTDKRYIQIRLLDKDTSHTVASGIGGDFRLKVAMTALDVGTYFDTAGTGSVTTVEIFETGATILSTDITVDATEKTSETAATPPIISDSVIAADGILTFNLSTVASGTAGKGLVVWMEVTTP